MAGRGWTPAGQQVALVWAWFVLALGVVALLVFPPVLQASESGYCENDDHPGPCADAVDLFGVPLAILAMGGATLAPTLAWRRGRAWGRWGVAVAFSLWALGALGGAEAVVRSEDGLKPGPLALWLAVAAGFGAVAVIAARSSPPGVQLAMGPDQGHS